MILIVDDYDDGREVLVRLLQLEGYQAVGAASGPEALEFLAEQTPALAVLDYNMPEMDGITLFHEMKKRPSSAGIPVIMFSANLDATKELALKAGVNAYVEKSSLDWMMLRREIERFAGPPGSASRLPMPPERREKYTG